MILYNFFRWKKEDTIRSPNGKYSQYDELYRQYKYGTGVPEDDFYITEYLKGSKENMIKEIPDLIVAIKGNCLSVCVYEDSLKGPDDNFPVPTVKKEISSVII